MCVDVDKIKNWVAILPFVAFTYNIEQHETTVFAPFYFLHGWEAETIRDTMFPFCLDDINDSDNYLNRQSMRTVVIRQLARLQTLQVQENDGQSCDSKHRVLMYQPGDLEWVSIPIRKAGLSEKLLKVYFGP